MGVLFLWSYTKMQHFQNYETNKTNKNTKTIYKQHKEQYNKSVKVLDKEVVNMLWETVKIKNERKGRTMPYASVGFGRLSLSCAACDLIDNFDTYAYVELLKAVVNNETLIGVRFLKEDAKTTNSLPIKRRKLKDGSVVGGIDISNKGTMAELFGLAGTQNKATRYGVKRDPDEENVLIIFGEK